MTARSFLLGLAAALLTLPAARAEFRPAGDDALAPARITALMRKAADYQIEHASEKPDNDWIRSTFYAGVMAAYRSTGDTRYRDAAVKWANEQGNWTPPRDRRHADALCCGQVYTELYFEKPDPERIGPIKAAFDQMIATPKPGRVDWWWCDALFMAPPVLPRLAAATGDQKYNRFLNDMFWDATDFLYSPEDKLYFRDANFFNAKTKNGKKVFWSRGNGWVMAGLPRILEYLPTSDPKYADYLKLHQEMSAKVASLQGADGMWRSSLLDPAEFPSPETSGTAFFCYAMAWGINNGTLDRAKYLPVAQKAWKGLVGALNDEGRLGYVQQVAGSPGAVKPDGTQEYAVGGFLLAGSEMMKLSGAAPRFDIGEGPVEAGYTPVRMDTTYSPEAGFGWLPGSDPLLPRDRQAPDPLRRDYAFGHGPATFRVNIKPGLYRLALIMGDMEYGDHVERIAVDVDGVTLPEIRTGIGEFATLTVAFPVTKDTLDIRFDSRVNNWVINAISLEPAERIEPVRVERKTYRAARRNTWADVSSWPDPIAPYLARYRHDVANAKPVQPTGLTRADYLRIITGEVDFWKTQQRPDGAIIDPYKNIEWQYSTPAFALSAALLVDQAGRADLLEPAAKAMDWSVKAMTSRTAPQHHEDFFAPMLAHALPLLRTRVDPIRASEWERQIREADPYKTYTSGIGGGNWNVVALSGEALFYKMGLRDNRDFVEDSLAAQGKNFRSPLGLYLEGPMAYDHFPRLWAADMIAAGYDGEYAAQLAEVLRRGALTSLFMQSPNGELPVGGRSALHQWNEAEQCVTYEIYAAKALKDGDRQLAAAFKRAAHLSLASMFRWVRPSGEMWIVKNRFDPAQNLGYEGYSAHSQYNLLPMAMLAIAYQHAESTEVVSEIPAPSEVGGFVLPVPELHKVFANAGGMYVELDTNADSHYNATGLNRIQQSGFNTALGPNDSIASHPSFRVGTNARTDAAAGVAWKDIHGDWQTLASYTDGDLSRVDVLGVTATPNLVRFQALYHGYLRGPAMVSETYTITPRAVELTSELPGYDGPLRYIWPVLADDGAQKTDIRTGGGTVSVSLGGDTQTFWPIGAASVSVGDTLYGNHSGLNRLAVAEYPNGGSVTLRIEPRRGDRR